MKILHTADWHIGQFKGPVVDGVNLRSQDTVNCLNYMIKVAEEAKPDIVCVYIPACTICLFCFPLQEHHR